MQTLADIVLGIMVVLVWVLIWTLPFKKKIYDWFDMRWPR